MPVEFVEQALLFFAHEYGQVVFAERKLKMHAAHIRVDDMRFDIERAVMKPDAACGIVHIIERERAGLQIAEAELYCIELLPVKEGKRSDVLIIGSLVKTNGKTFKSGIICSDTEGFAVYPICSIGCAGALQRFQPERRSRLFQISCCFQIGRAHV